MKRYEYLNKSMVDDCYMELVESSNGEYVKLSDVVKMLEGMRGDREKVRYLSWNRPTIDEVIRRLSRKGET